MSRGKNVFEKPDLRVVEEEEDGTPDFPATPFTAASLCALEPFDWVYKRMLLSRYFTALGAPAGTGKSAFIVVVAISIATGRALLGGAAPERRPVWIINLEDPRDSILKLIWAACEQHDVEPVDLEGWLYVNSGRDKPLLIAKMVGDKMLHLPTSTALADTCKARKIGALFIDPVVDTHALVENDNIQMNEYCAIWNRLAEKCQMAVCLSMHFRKGGVGGDPDSFRGASAIIGKARVGLTLSTATEDDAKKLSIPPERRSYYLRLDNAKRNLSPPPTKADWLRLESIRLSIGDDIQAIVEWSPPSPWEGLSMAQAVECLEAIDAGPGAGEYYSPSARGRTNDRWAGVVLINAGRDNEQAKQILNQWLQQKTLISGVYHSPSSRKETPCVRVDTAKLADMRASITLDPGGVWEG